MGIEYLDSRIDERFWKKVFPDPMSGCWLWIGATGPHGYGNWAKDGVWYRPHRLVCELNYGVKSPVAMHLCDVRICCNPDHLRPGTALDNVRDMDRKGRRVNASSAKTHCKHGHEFSVLNTMWIKRGKCRRCKICAAAADHRTWLARKASHD